jgi:hypothetical protein
MVGSVQTANDVVSLSLFREDGLMRCRRIPARLGAASLEAAGVSGKIPDTHCPAQY